MYKIKIFCKDPKINPLVEESVKKIELLLNFLFPIFILSEETGYVYIKKGWVEVTFSVPSCKECVPINFIAVGSSGLTIQRLLHSDNVSASSWCTFNVTVFLYAYIPPFLWKCLSIPLSLKFSKMIPGITSKTHYLLLQLNLPLQRLIVPFFQRDLWSNSIYTWHIFTYLYT